MRIGELSQRAGVNIQTVRFYERQNLLRKPARTAAGYRSYVEADLARVVFIKQSQQLGFTLHEIRELIEIHDPQKSAPGARAKAGEWSRAVRLAEARLQQIDEKIRFLRNFRAQLSAVVKDGYSRFCAAPEGQSSKSKVADMGSCPVDVGSCPAAEHLRKRRKKKQV
jgi:DNA-binding transcriptional MerR regulator